MRLLSFFLQPLLSVVLLVAGLAVLSTLAGIGSAYVTLGKHLVVCDRSASVSCVAERSTIEE